MTNQDKQKYRQQQKLAKARLDTIYNLDRTIDRKEEELKLLRSDVAGISGFRYDEDKVQTSPNSDKMVDSVAKIMELEEDIKKSIDQLARERHAIMGQIEQMQDENQRELLFRRYVEYQSFEKIAVGMHYSYGYIRNLHSHALIEFYRICKM